MFLGFLFLFLLLIFGIAIGGFSIFVLGSALASNIYGAPYVPISRKLIGELLAFSSLSASDIFYDLGSGDGRVLIAVAMSGVGEAIGYEVAPWPYLKSKFSVWRLGLSGKIKVARRSFFKSRLDRATFVYIYLFPELVDKLGVKIETECRSGTRILCPDFPIDLTKHPRFRLIKSQKIDKITAYLYQLI